MPHSSSGPSRVTSRVVLSDELIDPTPEFLTNIPAWCIAQTEPQPTPVYIKVSTPHSTRGDPKASTFGLDHKHPLINKLLNREMDPRFAEISVKNFINEFLPGEGLNPEKLSKLQSFDHLTTVVQTVAANKARNKGKKKRKKNKNKRESSGEEATTNGEAASDNSAASEHTDDIEMCDETDETSETEKDELTSQEQEEIEGRNSTGGEGPRAEAVNRKSVSTPNQKSNANQTSVS
jgi:hypothetical protein